IPRHFANAWANLGSDGSVDPFYFFMGAPGKSSSRRSTHASLSELGGHSREILFYRQGIFQCDQAFARLADHGAKVIALPVCKSCDYLHNVGGLVFHAVIGGVHPMPHLFGQSIIDANLMVAVPND